jgi:DNA ligase-1
MVRKGSGLAIRFPRYMGKVRQDKPAEEATSTDEMLAMYEMQAR